MRTTAIAALLSMALTVGFGQAGAAEGVTHGIGGTITDAVGHRVPWIFAQVCPVASTDCGPSARADEAGTYLILGVTPGTYVVRFTDGSDLYPDGYYSLNGFTESQAAATAVTVSSADVTGISITYPPTHTIRGTIRAPDNSPLANTSVVACHAAGPGFCRQTRSATDGTYIIEVSAGSYTVDAYDARGDYLPIRYPASGPDGPATTLDVVADVADLDITFAPARYVSGTLSYPGGIIYDYSNPKEEFGQFGINVLACDAANPDVCNYGGAADEDGAFRITVAPGSYILRLDNLSTFADNVLLPGYWSSEGLVADAAHATVIDATAGDRSGITAAIVPIGVSEHAGTARTGSFGTQVVTVRAGGYVTVRFELGKGFAGAHVAISTTTGTSSTEFAGDTTTTGRVVAADGFAYYTVRVRGWMGFRAAYTPPAAFLDALYGDPDTSSFVVTSPLAVADGS